MKTLSILTLALCLTTLPAAISRAADAGYDGGSAGVASQPKPGASFLWMGTLRTNCHVVAVNKESVTISSSGGAFVVVWEKLPDEARKQMQPEYDALVKLTRAAGEVAPK